jgi:hypothetical protein
LEQRQVAQEEQVKPQPGFLPRSAKLSEFVNLQATCRHFLRPV